MQAYINRFEFASNNTKSEFVLNFLQNSPTFEKDESGNTVFNGNVVEEPVVRLVMTAECARNLANCILRNLGEPQA